MLRKSVLSCILCLVFISFGIGICAVEDTAGKSPTSLDDEELLAKYLAELFKKAEEKSDHWRVAKPTCLDSGVLAPCVFYPICIVPVRPREEPPYILRFDDRGDMALIWDENWNRFKWTPIALPRPKVPTALTIPQYEAVQLPRSRTKTLAKTVEGELLKVEVSADNPRITMRVDGKQAVYSISREAVILRGPEEGRAEEVPMVELQPGDMVTVRLNSAGIVDLIRSKSGRVIEGKVSAVANGTILLENGQTFRVSAETEVFLPSGAKGKYDDVCIGSLVEARLSYSSERATSVKIKSSPGEVN